MDYVANPSTSSNLDRQLGDVISDIYGEDNAATDVDRFQASVENNMHPLLRRPATIAYLVISSFFIVFSIITLGLALHVYVGSATMETTYNDLDLSFIRNKTTGETTFANACYSCTKGADRDENGNPLPNQQDNVLTFKGQLGLTDGFRQGLQFPTGVIIANMATIVQDNKSTRKLESYVNFKKGFGSTTNNARQLFAQGSKLATWVEYGSASDTSNSIVPGTEEIDTTTVPPSTGFCTNVADDASGGPIYGAFNSTYDKALCTCIPVTGGVQELCLGLVNIIS
jgi:hypothetical protein